MVPSNKRKWLKVIEFAVVGLISWWVPYTEISEFCEPLRDRPVGHPERIRRSEPLRDRPLDHPERIRRSETEFLLFLLKLWFQLLIALQTDDNSDRKAKQNWQLLLVKLWFQMLAGL